MKNKNFTLLLLGLGALLFFTKKGKDETKGDDSVSPDVGNGKNDVSKDATTDVVVVDATETTTSTKVDKTLPANTGVVPPSADSPYMY